MQRPTVSVGLPVYNGEDYLEGAIEAIVGQTFEDFELLLGDNCSTDSTGEICARWAAKDPRIRHLRAEENRGLAWNWNRLVDAAEGRYFRWAAHDDLVAPELLERCVDVLDAAPSDVVLVYPKTTEIDADGVEIGPYEDRLDLRERRPHQRLRHYIDQRFRNNPLFGLMRVEALRTTRRMGSYGHADTILLAELCLLGQFWEVPERLFQRRIHPGMSIAAVASPQELVRFYDTSADATVVLPRTKTFSEYLRAIGRAPIPATDRALCLGVLLRSWRLRWWRAMGGEVKRAARHAVAARRGR